MESEPLTLVVDEEEAGTRLDSYVAAHIAELSRSRVQKLIDTANVRVNGAAEKSRYAVQAEDVIDIDIPPPEAGAPQPEKIPLDVVHEDEDLMVIDKPAGMVVHPGAGVSDGTMVNALLDRLGPLSVIGGVMRPGIVHRLDKDTSGLIIIAKNDVTHRALSDALAAREVSRIYWTIALRRFEKKKGTIEAPIGRHPTVRTRMAVTKHGRASMTYYEILEEFGGFSLVRCRLASGRTHQIRVHLAHEKHPVLGDDLYGGGVTVALQLVNPRAQALRNAVRLVNRQMLHARELSFAHPRSGAKMQFVSELPEDFAATLAALRAESKPA